MSGLPRYPGSEPARPEEPEPGSYTRCKMCEARPEHICSACGSWFCARHGVHVTTSYFRSGSFAGSDSRYLCKPCRMVEHFQFLDFGLIGVLMTAALIWGSNSGVGVGFVAMVIAGAVGTGTITLVNRVARQGTPVTAVVIKLAFIGICVAAGCLLAYSLVQP